MLEETMTLSDIETIKESFKEELRNAEKRKESSLSFFINQIPPKPIVEDGQIFQVLTIGGSVRGRALIKKEGGKLFVLKKERSPLPIFRTQEDLFRCVRDLLDEKTTILAINFAYPIDPFFNGEALDAILVKGTKEHLFEGLVGRAVGQAIEEHLLKQSKRRVKVSLANDTICLLLAGLISHPWDSLAGMVLGTGFNMALFLDRDRLVNLEVGNFSKFLQTEEGEEIDRQSAIPGVNIFEKEVSGGYLYSHFNLLIKKRNVSYPELSSTEGLSDVLSSGKLEARQIAQEVFSRSSKYIASIIAGVLEYIGRDLTFNVEGSLFWKAPGYKEAVEKNVKLITEFKAEFIKIEDSSILGAAKLVA